MLKKFNIVPMSARKTFRKAADMRDIEAHVKFDWKRDDGFENAKVLKYYPRWFANDEPDLTS